MEDESKGTKCPCGLIDREETLFKVRDGLRAIGLNDESVTNAIHEMQNRGIYFREAAQ